MIDARFDTPMGELLSRLPLVPDMCDALLEHEGRKGDMLGCLDALENEDFDKAEGILSSVFELYLSALACADEITEPLFGRGEAAAGARKRPANQSRQTLLVRVLTRS